MGHRETAQEVIPTASNGATSETAGDPIRVGTVVLDIDGVLVDVTNSYRQATVDAVDHVYSESIPKANLQAFKNAGGFNNDWKLTDAVALYVLARRGGLDDDVVSFTNRIARAGGGLAGARAVVESSLLPDAMEQVFDKWDTNRLREVFQHQYLGSERYAAMTGTVPERDTTGYIESEPIIVDPETLSWFIERFDIGVISGRPKAEAVIALDRVNLSLPDDHLFTMDSDMPEKPAPAALVALTEEFDTDCAVFVGDTLDDIRLAVHAREADPARDYRGIGVLTGGLSGQQGRDMFIDAGADAVVDSVNDLPVLLRRD